MKFRDLTKIDRKDRMLAVIKHLVKKQKYTQRPLAAALGISKTKVGAILVGDQYIDGIELPDWLEVLEVTPNEFFEMLDSPPPLED